VCGTASAVIHCMLSFYILSIGMHREEWPHLTIQPGHVHCCPPQRAKLSIKYLMGLSITPASLLHPHMAKLLLTFGPAANKVGREAIILSEKITCYQHAIYGVVAPQRRASPVGVVVHARKGEL